MSFTVRGLAAAALLATTAISAQAADLGYKKPGVLPALATFNPWMIRVRAIGVIGGGADRVTLGAPVNAIQNGLKVGASFVPELDITYFFTKNIAAELILGTSHHNIKTKNQLTTTTGVSGVGSTWVLPPTLTLQYHFTDFGAFKPYVGVGVNYTIFYGENPKQANGFTKLRIESAAGLAAQVGFDYMVNKNWGFNVDVKKLYLRPIAKTTFGGAVPVKAKVNLDPWILGVGVTYKF